MEISLPPSSHLIVRDCGWTYTHSRETITAYCKVHMSSSRPLKVCILAAGYGTRLERDIREDETGRFNSLIGLVLTPNGSTHAFHHAHSQS